VGGKGTNAHYKKKQGREEEEGGGDQILIVRRRPGLLMRTTNEETPTAIYNEGRASRGQQGKEVLAKETEMGRARLSSMRMVRRER